MSSAPRKKERSSDGSTRIVCKLPGCEKPTWPNDRELETARSYHHQRYHQESARIIYQGRSVEIRRDPATGKFRCPCGEPQHARRMAINTRTLCRPQVHPPPDTPSAGEAATDDEGFGFRRAAGTQSSAGGRTGSQSSAGGGAGSQSSAGTRVAQGGAGTSSAVGCRNYTSAESSGAGASARGRTKLQASASTSTGASASTSIGASAPTSTGASASTSTGASTSASANLTSTGAYASAASGPKPASASVPKPASASVPKPASSSVPKPASASVPKTTPLPRKRRRGSPEVIEVGSDSEDGGTVLVKRVKREPGAPAAPKPNRCTNLKPIRRTVSASPSSDAEDTFGANDEDKVEVNDEEKPEVEVEDEEKPELNGEDKIEVNGEDKPKVDEEDKVEIGDEDGAEVKDESGAMEQYDEEDRGPREEDRGPREEARSQRPQEEARAQRAQKAVRADRYHDDAPPTGAQGEGGAARRLQGKGGNAAPAAEDAARGRRETKTERELTLEEKFERNKALERKLHEQLDKQYEAYQEKLRAMEALMS